MPKAINSASQDHTTEGGSRLSIPVYLDPPMATRKQMLNGIRERITQSQLTSNTPKTMSGLSTDTVVGQTQVEAYLGMTMDVLRAVIFQRGGLPLDMFLRLQAVSGVEVITEKDIKAGFDARKKQCVELSKVEPFVTNELEVTS